MRLFLYTLLLGYLIISQELLAQEGSTFNPASVIGEYEMVSYRKTDVPGMISPDEGAGENTFVVGGTGTITRDNDRYYVTLKITYRTNIGDQTYGLGSSTISYVGSLTANTTVSGSGEVNSPDCSCAPCSVPLKYYCASFLKDEIAFNLAPVSYPVTKAPWVVFNTDGKTFKTAIGGYSVWRKKRNIIHFHQIVRNSLFSKRELLIGQKTSQTGYAFAVCADGSDASVFVISGNNLANVRIQEASVSFPDTLNYGKFTILSSTNNELVVRYRHPSQTLFSSYARFLNINVSTADPTPIVESYPLLVFQAPVLMVHGLDSDPSAFAKMENKLLTSGYWSHLQLHRADYKSSNKSSFSTNASVIPSSIDILLGKLRTNGIAAGSVDIVGHSMGGLLSRGYLQSSNYRYDIHKLITLNTPHAGSQVANIKADLSFNPIYANNLRNLILVGVSILDEGAITDLAVGSNAIGELNRPGNLNAHTVPIHAIATTAPYLFIPPADGQFGKPNAARVLSELLNINLNNTFGETTHDLVVSRSSQLGGLSGTCTTTFNDQIHIGSPDNNLLFTKLTTLLRQPTTVVDFCKNGYNPPTLTYTKTFVISPIKDKITSVATTNASIKIDLPIQGKVVNGGSTIQLQATGTNLASLWLYVSYPLDSVYRGYKSGNQANFTFTIDKFAGKRYVVAIGKTANGEFVSDSTYFSVVNNFCETLQSGNWENTTTWSCGHEPTSSDVVSINPSHIITVSSNTAQAQRIIYKGGVIQFSIIGAKVFVKGGN